MGGTDSDGGTRGVPDGSGACCDRTVVWNAYERMAVRLRRVAYRVFRRIAATGWLYDAPAQRALDQARRLGWAADEADWLLRRRLTTLVDHADH